MVGLWWPVATFCSKTPTPFFPCGFRVGSSVISYQNDAKLKSINQWTNRPFLRDVIWVRLTKDTYFDSKLHVVAKFIVLKTLVRWWCKGIPDYMRKKHISIDLVWKINFNNLPQFLHMTYIILITFFQIFIYIIFNVNEWI
jgi:hypothetical protein